MLKETCGRGFARIWSRSSRRKHGTGRRLFAKTHQTNPKMNQSIFDYLPFSQNCSSLAAEYLSTVTVATFYPFFFNAGQLHCPRKRR